MKKLLAFLFFVPALVWAQCNPFATNQVLTASALNSALSAACITSGTITGLSSPIPIASGGTNATTASAALANLGGLPLAGGTITGNLVVNGTITPSQTSGIVGTSTNNSANAGSVGEYATNTTTAVSLTTLTPANITSVSLTAGDWDVQGTIAFLEASGTTPTYLSSSISQTSATVGGFGTRTALNLPYTASVAPQDMLTPTVRISLASTTTVYLVGSATFSGGTLTANGFIRARRVR